MILIKTQIIWFRAPPFCENNYDKNSTNIFHSVWVTRPTSSHLGAIRARLGPVGGDWRQFCVFEATMRQYEHELICFRTAFRFVNISSPWYCTEMVLYSIFLYGSQFSGEKSHMKILYLVPEIISKNRVSFFWGTPPCTVLFVVL